MSDRTEPKLAYAPPPALPDVPPTTAYQRDRLRHQLAFLLRDGQQWRTVITDSDSLDGIAPRCTSPHHPEDDKLQQGVVYDCCDFRAIETHSVKLAEFFVAATRAVPALLAERDALAARVAQQDAEMQSLAETVVRLQCWLAGRQGKVHSVVSSTSVIAEPRDRSTAAWAIAESDVAAVVAVLEARIVKAGE